MRILYLVNDAAFFLSHRLPLAMSARERGHIVAVAAAPVRGYETIAEMGFAFHPLPFRRSATGLFGELLTLLAVYRLIRRIKPDLIHNVTIKPVLYGSLAARFAGVPAIVNAVSGLGTVFLAEGLRARILRSLVQWIYRLVLRAPNCITIFQNEDDRDLFVQRKLVPRQQTVLIRGSGVDTRLFSPTPEPDGIPVVALCARMLRDKGVDEFVQAATLLKAQGVQARFELVGGLDPGNRTAISETQMRQWVEEGSVEWLGHRPDMPAVLRDAHIICLPSYREGLPKALLEAAASGRPIVTTDVPGCREVVINGSNGLLVPVRNVPVLATALRRLIEDPVLRATFGQAGRRRVEQYFALEQVVAQTMTVYERLLYNQQ